MGNAADCNTRHAQSPPRMGGRDLETNRRLQIHRPFRWGSRQQCPSLLPALEVAGDSSASDRTLETQLQGDSPQLSSGRVR